MQKIKVSVFLLLICSLQELNANVWGSFRTKWPNYKPKKYYPITKRPENFCCSNLCPKGEKHVACSKKFWGPSCPPHRQGYNMAELKELIVCFHNRIRWHMTHKSVGELLPSQRLGPITWDEQLSSLAIRIVNNCDYQTAHKCANTKNYPHVGQSLGELTNVTLPLPQAVMYIMKDWHFEYRYLQSGDIENLSSDAIDKSINFLNIVHDKVNRVGCGIIYFERDNIPHTLLACLYNTDIKVGQKLYSIELAQQKTIKAFVDEQCNLTSYYDSGILQ